MDIHERIRVLREAKGLSQSDMANSLKIATQNYWKIEKGKTELTVSRLTQIAEILGISANELLMGEPQKVEDSDKVRELENRIKELNDIVKLYQDNSQMKDREFERIKEYFEKCIYDEIAAEFFEKGYSKLRAYNATTGKKVVSGDKEELIKLFKDQIIDRHKKMVMDFLSRETRNEMIDRFTKELFQLEKGSLDDTYISYFEIRDVICKASNLEPWELRVEYVVIDKFKQKAVNNYFYNLLGDFGMGNKLEIIFESGIITDKTLLTSYKRVKYLDEEDVEEGYEINEDLEIVKEIERKRFDPNQPR